MSLYEYLGINSVVLCQPELNEKPQAQYMDEMHLRKRFRLLCMLAFGFTTMNSWVAFASGIFIPLLYSGGPSINIKSGERAQTLH